MDCAVHTKKLTPKIKKEETLPKYTIIENKILQYRIEPTTMLTRKCNINAKTILVNGFQLLKWPLP